MKARNYATVTQSDLVQAADQVLRRRKHFHRGMRGVPKTTLIYALNGLLIVYTPFLRSALSMEGTWVDCIAVNAVDLALACKKLAKSDRTTLTFAGGGLALGDGVYVLKAESCRPPTDS